jgi:thioredoxin-related protein
MRPIIFFFALCVPLFCYAAPVPLAEDLRQDGVAAEAESKTVVVLFTASYCEYCEAVKSEFFNHILKDVRYSSRIVLREVVLDSAFTLRDFSGEQLSHGAFADREGVFLVPQVSFFGPAGNTLTDPLVGVVTMDFYGWYVDKRINRALDNIRASP